MRKTLRREWPQVRQFSRGKHIYTAVDLRRAGYNGQKWKNFKTATEALEYARRVAEKVKATGVNSINKLNADPRIANWEQQLAIYGKTIEQAINSALTLYAQQQKDKASPFISGLLTLWVDDRKNDKLNPLRPRSLKSLRVAADTFKKDLNDAKLIDITQERIEQYLNTKGDSNQYRENLRNYLGQFFNWAIKKGYSPTNPAKKIEIRVIRTTPVFFSVDDSSKVMKLAVKHNMAGYFSLCLFGGVRPEEAEKLSWGHINLTTKEITIPADISKTKKPRQWVMSDTLYKWLGSLDNKQPLIQSGWRKAKRAVIKAMGNWQQDVLRHTFCTYTYALHHKLEELSYVMGNSPRIIETFYRGIIPQAEVEKWFKILPK